MVKLTPEEKEVLTLLDGIRTDKIEQHIQKFVSIPKYKIQKTIIKLKKLKLIEMISMPNDNKTYYFYDTRKIKAGMLNDDLRFRKDYGNDSLLLDFSNKNKPK